MKSGNLLFIFFIICILFFGCSTEQKKDCEENKYGTITIENNSSNPYDIYANNTFLVRVFGNTISSNLKIQEGNNIKFYAEQSSGYILYPTTRSISFNVVRCSKYSWQIP